MVNEKMGPLSRRIHLLSLGGRLGKNDGLIHWSNLGRYLELAAELDENSTKMHNRKGEVGGVCSAKFLFMNQLAKYRALS